MEDGRANADGDAIPSCGAKCEGGERASFCSSSPSLFAAATSAMSLRSAWLARRLPRLPTIGVGVALRLQLGPMLRLLLDWLTEWFVASSW